MTRTKRFADGVSTGIISIIINILYTIFSVKLALYYLGKEQFGLWALALQLSSYMTLIDFGMNASVSRFIADVKDHVNGGEYGSILLTGGIVFAIQGLVIAIFGSVLSWLAPYFFKVPPSLVSDFRWALVIITTISGFSIMIRIVAAPLWAFQRADVFNLMGMMSLACNFLTLWFGLKMHWGIYSMAYAGLPGYILFTYLVYGICLRNGYYPSRGHWGAPSWVLFSKLFGYGKDLLLLTVGSQMVNATQIMILGRITGLEAAARFSIGTKLYGMTQQFIGKVTESAAPGLTEMYVQSDTMNFNSRFWNIVSLASYISALGGATLILCNQYFVRIWTSGAIHWTFRADVLLGLLLVATCFTRCLIGMFGMVGNYRPVRYIYLIEGLTFIFIALPACKKFGIEGVLGASIVAQIFVTGVISLKISRRYLTTTKPVFQIFLGTALTELITIILFYLIKKVPCSDLTHIVISMPGIIFLGILGYFLILDRSARNEIEPRILHLASKYTKYNIGKK